MEQRRKINRSTVFKSLAAAPHVTTCVCYRAVMVLSERRGPWLLRQTLLLALLVAIVLFTGMAAATQAQARENPQATTALRLSQSDDNDPCVKTVDVKGVTMTIGSVLANGWEAAQKYLPWVKAYDLAQCWNFQNSQSNHPPWSQPGDKPAAPDPPVFKTPTHEGEQCYSDPFARHPAGTFRNGAGCVGRPGNGNNSSGSTNSCPNGMVRISPETDTTSGCVVPGGKQEHRFKQGHDNPQKKEHNNGHRQDYPQRQGHQQQHNQQDAS